MSATKTASSITAPTQFLEVKTKHMRTVALERTPGRPLLFLQHFTGTA